MKIIKKAILLSCLLAAFSIPSIAAPDAAPNANTANAASYEWCEDLPVVTCEEENITFTKYQGELVSISPEGYDPGLYKAKSVRELVQKVVNYALSFLGLVAILLIIYAGVMYLTAGGQTEKTDKAKKAIGYTTVGLLLILGSYAIVNTILTGPFEGEGAVEGEVQGWAATGFNYSTEAISTSTKEIVQGYIFVYESYETFKTLKSDAAKDSLVSPPKSLILQYLNNARSKLQDLKFKATAFSQVSSKINDTIRWLNKKMDGIQMFADIANSGEEEGTLDFGGGLQAYWDGIQIDLFDPETPTSIPALFKVIIEDFAGIDGLLINQLPKLNKASKSIEGIAVENQVTSITGAFTDLTDKITTLQSSIHVGTTGDGGTGTLIDELSGGEKSDVIGVTNQNLRDVVFSADALTNLIKDIKFVQTKLVATASEGPAPLIVRFDVLGSVDPSGKTITESQIEWDLMGDGYIISGDSKCYEPPYNTLDKKGFTNFCVYETPGAYRASVKIKSSEPEKYGTGESKLDIKVKEPELKIGLKVGEEFVEQYDENYMLSTSRKYISFDKKFASENGIDFDASATEGYSGQKDMGLTYKWDFGNGKTSEEVSPTGIIYEFDGVYAVVLEVKSLNGKQATKI
ncbi:MAG: PKD domain-containing protein, partial [Candidatus Gracilibacteria bacterium]